MSFSDALRARIGRRLERGDPSPMAIALAHVFERAAASRLCRPLFLPEAAHVIGVGSAVLGGAGKTPVAIALTRAFSQRGLAAALIGHGYRAAIREARVVTADSRLAEVGDDALAAARLLEGTDARVLVAKSRQQALFFAETLGLRTLVVDGLLQAAPERLAASILVMDAACPLGSQRCPPAGDLRAPAPALLAASDYVAVLTPLGAALPSELPARAVAISSRTRFAVDAFGARYSLADLGRVGLFLAVARPERIEAAVRREGLVPHAIIALGDHASPSTRDVTHAAHAGVDAWLTTTRCATKMPQAIGKAPVLALDHELDVSALVERVLENLEQRGSMRT